MPDISLGQLTAWVVFGFLISLGGTIAFKLLNGGINTHGLLDGRTKNGVRFFSLGRLQLLLFTLWTAVNYISRVVNGNSQASLPDIPQQTLALLGGSHLLYLGGKAYSMFWQKAVGGNTSEVSGIKET